MKYTFTGKTKAYSGVILQQIVYENGLLGGWIEKKENLSGDARVYGDALVCGDAWSTSPLYIQGSMHAATNYAHGKIAIGCQIRTFQEWAASYKQIGKENGYSAEQIAEYKAIIDLFIKIGK